MVKFPLAYDLQMRCVLRTQNLEEANNMAEQYELQGFQASITKSTQGGISLYCLWIRGGGIKTIEDEGIR